MATTTDHPLAGATLFVSARSPFARRVRVALLETGVPVRERVEDVLRPSAELLQANPLGRVPTLVLPEGDVLVESQLILEHLFDGLGPDAAPLRREHLAQRRRADAVTGLAIGICERSVEYFFESLRPAEQRDQELLTEIRTGVAGAQARLQSHLGTGPGFLGAEPCMADFDVAIALRYFSLRVGEEWRERQPALAALCDRLEERESMRRTAPPPPA